jgi:hypothetical protein
MSVASVISELSGKLETISQSTLNSVRQAASSGSTEDLLLAQDDHFRYMNMVSFISTMRKSEFDLTQGILQKM